MKNSARPSLNPPWEVSHLPGCRVSSRTSCCSGNQEASEGVKDFRTAATKQTLFFLLSESQLLWKTTAHIAPPPPIVRLLDHSYHLLLSPLPP